MCSIDRNMRTHSTVGVSGERLRNCGDIHIRPQLVTMDNAPSASKARCKTRGFLIGVVILVGKFYLPSAYIFNPFWYRPLTHFAQLKCIATDFYHVVDHSPQSSYWVDG